MNKGTSLRENIAKGILPEYTGPVCVAASYRDYEVNNFETVCFWCELPIVVNVATRFPKLIPICCPRCKVMFWF